MNECVKLKVNTKNHEVLKIKRYTYFKITSKTSGVRLGFLKMIRFPSRFTQSQDNPDLKYLHLAFKIIECA